MSQPFIGEILLFGGNFAIIDYAFCNGQVLSISQNSTLFTLIGTTYGGDGQQTFALPNLQSRLPIHHGQGSGLSNYVIGQQGGVESVTLTTSNMPAHNHVFNATSTAANSLNISSTELPGNTAGGQNVVFYASNTGSPAPTFSTLAPQAIGSTGGSQPHNNIMPVLAMTYLIALYGVYPSQS
jgi:microcystin-dependent protein